MTVEEHTAIVKELNEELKTQAVVKPEEDNQLQKAVQVLKENK